MTARQFILAAVLLGAAVGLVLALAAPLPPDPGGGPVARPEDPAAYPAAYQVSELLEEARRIIREAAG